MWYDQREEMGVSTTTWTAAAAPPAPAAARGWHLLSVREVAAACQLSEKAVRRAIDDGELPAVKLRSRVRVTPEDLKGWIAASSRNASTVRPSPRRRAPRQMPAGTFRSLIKSEAEL
jgi:excisionase family DNA binding protein